MLKPSETAVEFTVDVFDASADELNKLSDGAVDKQMRTDGYLGFVVFAVLDERSTKDDTVVLYYDEVILDEVTDEENDAVLHAYRVKFADAHDMVGLIENCNISVIEEYVLKAGPRFTNEDGVFEFAEAVRAVDAGDRG